MADNIQSYRWGDLHIMFEVDKPAGPHWWTDGNGAGVCWVKDDVLIISGYKAQGKSYYGKDCATHITHEGHIEALGDLPEWDRTQKHYCLAKLTTEAMPPTVGVNARSLVSRLEP